MISSESAKHKTKNPSQAYQAAIEYGINADQLDHLLTLTPLERLQRHDAALALVLAAHKAGIKYYGFNPGSPETSQ